MNDEMKGNNMIAFSKIDDNLSIYREKKVILFGAGKDGKKVKMELENLGIIIKCFCDMDLKKCNTEYLGIKVISLAELIAIDLCDCVVQISTGRYDFEISTLLNQNGIEHITYAEYKERIIEWTKYCAQKDGMIDESYMKEVKSVGCYPALIKDYLTYLQYTRTGEALFVCMPPKTGNYSMYKMLNDAECNYFDAHHIFSEVGNILTKMNYQGKVKIISAVRDPIAQNISLMFQHTHFCWGAQEYWDKGGDVEAFFPAFMFYQLDKESVWKDLFPKQRRFKIPMYEFHDRICKLGMQVWHNNWFTKEIGVNIYDYPFNTSTGYQVIEKDNLSIFIFQLERIQDILPFLNEFIGAKDIKLAFENIGSRKWYSKSYEIAKKNMSISREFIEWSYRGKMATHFYEEKDIKKFCEKWKNIL